MSRFERFSRISPLALYQERERLAWCCAGVAVALLVGVVVAGFELQAPARRGAGSGRVDFVGVWGVEASAPVQVVLPALALPARPAVEAVVEVPLAVAEVVEVSGVSCLEWEGVELVAEGEALLELELPEALGRAAPARAGTRSAVAAEKVCSARGELVAARYRSTPRPPYPPSLLNRRVQGGVGLTIRVDAEGVPQEVTVSSSSGYAAFDRTAREWVLAHWRFHPARQGGAAVASVVRTRVEFVLR